MSIDQTPDAIGCERSTPQPLVRSRRSPPWYGIDKSCYFGVTTAIWEPACVCCRPTSATRSLVRLETGDPIGRPELIELSDSTRPPANGSPSLWPKDLKVPDCAWRFERIQVLNH